MHTFYRPFTILIFLIIFFPLTVQLLNGMELKTPESYKEFLINNTEGLEKQYIDAQKVTWHKNGQAYSFIHQEERDKLLFKLVFYCTSDQKIYRTDFDYDMNYLPVYPLPNDNAFPQFNDHDQILFTLPQLPHDMELKTPESYKELLINNAEDLDKQYIDAQKVNWHQNSQAYTFIDKDEQDKLFFKLVFYFTPDQAIYRMYFSYDIKTHPMCQLSNDNALPQLNDNDQIFFILPQLLNGMEPKTPESFKELLINNAEDLDKQYIDAQKVTWHKNGQAYTFIHQEERDKLLHKLVFYYTSNQTIYRSYSIYDVKDHPIYPFPHDNVLPQFNDNNEAYFHADGYIKIPNNKNFYRALILYVMPTNPNSKPKAFRCRIGVPPSPDNNCYHIDYPPSHNCTYLLPFKSLLTALLNSSEPRIVYTNYKEEDQVMVYFIYKTYIPDDYPLCTVCNHIQPYSYRGIKYFEDLPDKLRMLIIKQYQNQLKKKTIEQNSSYNKPRILQRDPQPTNINDVLKNDALLINELTRRSKKKNKHSKKLYQAEETLLQAFESNIFKHYSPKTRENALTIRNNVIARDDMIQLIHNNNIKDFLIWTRYNPTALNIHSPVLNDGTLVHFIVHHIAPNDCNAFLNVALQHKPNLNRLDKYGRTPLFYAIINKNLAIAQQLVKNGASTRLKDHTKNTLMHYAVCQNIHDNNINKQKEIINFCLKNTQELNAKNNFGNTPAHLALLGDIDQELLEILFSNVSLNFSLKNKKGETLQSILKEKPACQNRERITQLIDATLEQKRKCSCTEKFKQIKT